MRPSREFRRYFAVPALPTGAVRLPPESEEINPFATVELVAPSVLRAVESGFLPTLGESRHGGVLPELTQSFLDSLDQSQQAPDETLSDQEKFEQIAIGTTAIMTTGLSVGYVV